MSIQDAHMAHSEGYSMVSYAKRAASFALFVALSGCVIVTRVPPPAQGDPYQPPPAAPIALNKGDVHKLRFECGAQATFRSSMGIIQNLVVAFNGENLSPAGQLTSTALRLSWKGPGAAMDVPFNVGSQHTRTAMGEFTMNATAGSHDFIVAMPTGPDCGPTKVTVAFR